MKTDKTIRDGLCLIASNLAHNTPGRLMTTSDRLAAALTIADNTHPRDEDAAVQLERDLLRHMPFVDGNIVTRGEYALWLHKHTWGM